MLFGVACYYHCTPARVRLLTDALRYDVSFDTLGVLCLGDSQVLAKGCGRMKSGFFTFSGFGSGCRSALP